MASIPPALGCPSHRSRGRPLRSPEVVRSSGAASNPHEAPVAWAGGARRGKDHWVTPREAGLTAGRSVNLGRNCGVGQGEAGECHQPPPPWETHGGQPTGARQWKAVYTAGLHQVWSPARTGQHGRGSWNPPACVWRSKPSGSQEHSSGPPSQLPLPAVASVQPGGAGWTKPAHPHSHLTPCLCERAGSHPDP